MAPTTRSPARRSKDRQTRKSDRRPRNALRTRKPRPANVRYQAPSNNLADSATSQPLTDGDTTMTTQRDILRHIGLHDTAADVIVDSYDPQDDFRADLMTYVEGYVLSHRAEHHVLPESYEDELKRCGLSNEVATCHMDPEDAVFREMQEPWYWVLDTLRTRYMIYESSVQDLDSSGSDSDTYPDGPVEGGAKKRRKSKATSGKTATGAKTASDPSVKLGAKGKEKQQVGQGSGDGKATVQLVETPRPPSEDEVIWYKGGVDWRFKDSYDDVAHSIRPLNLLSFPPTDFAGPQSCLYFTDSVDCARKYAMWAVRRVGSERVCPVILHLYIPKPWIRSLADDGVVQYLTIAQFQELVWWSYRLAYEIGGETELITKIKKERKILIGPISAATPNQVRRLADASGISAGKFNNERSNQVGILFTFQNDTVFASLSTFEALLCRAS